MGFSRQEYWSGVSLPSPTYTLQPVKQIASGNLLLDTGSSSGDSVTTWRGGMGWEVQEGGDICLLMADSFECMVETNTIL